MSEFKELKPCPNCGGEIIEVSHEDGLIEYECYGCSAVFDGDEVFTDQAKLRWASMACDNASDGEVATS